MAAHVSPERLAAYLAVSKTITVLALEKNTTIGGIVEEVLLDVEQACQEGRLGAEIYAYEVDPDA